MRLIYLANIRLPTEKAHGYQIMRTCAELVRQGVDVELVVPKRRNVNLGNEDPFAYYGVSPQFPIRRLPTVDWTGRLPRWFGPIGFWMQSATFAWSARRYLTTAGADWVYGRDELTLALVGQFHQRLAIELHALPKPKYRRLLTRSAAIVVINRAIRDALVKQAIAGEKIVVAPDAVDVAAFANLPPPASCRKNVGLPPDKKIALYAGHFYQWKGVFTLAEAAGHLPPDWLVVFIGGVPEDAKQLRAYLKNQTSHHVSFPRKRESRQQRSFWIPAQGRNDNRGSSEANSQHFSTTRQSANIQIVPHQPHDRVPMWLGAADVLVLPNSAKTDRSRLYTSPLKLFEYLAAGRPIVASDLPSIHEIVSEREVIFVKPDDPPDLARGIREAGERDQSARIQRAQQLARQYSWEERVKRLLNFIKNG